jgi:hypothetical protein
MDFILQAWAELQQSLFEAVVVPLTFSMGLGHRLEEAFNATGWFMMGLVQLLILLVAWRLSATANCSGAIPQPLSSTLISRTPPARKRTWMWLAPASSALSNNSRSTDAGRSITSPAAI